MDRREEVRALLRMSPDEVRQKAGDRLTVVEDLGRLHGLFAETILTEIDGAASAGRACRLILPVGPTGQYPLLARMINDADRSLEHSHSLGKQN